MDAEKIEYGITLRDAQQAAKDAFDQAAEAYGRFLESLTDEELNTYITKQVDKEI